MFFCLGVASSGLKEVEYAPITWGFPLAAGALLSRFLPGVTFLDISPGCLRLGNRQLRERPFLMGTGERPHRACLAPPAAHGNPVPPRLHPADDGHRVENSLPAHLLSSAGPLMALPGGALPNQVLRTREIGRAKLSLARQRLGKRVLETGDIRAGIRRDERQRAASGYPPFRGAFLRTCPRWLRRCG